MNINPFFDVIRRPAFITLDDEEVSVNRDALVNAENKQVLGLVARNYRVVTNGEVAEVFGQAFRDFPVSHTSDHLNGTTALWQRDFVFSGPEYTRIIGNDDVVDTQVSIWNGYTGTNSVGFQISAFRRRTQNRLIGWGNVGRLTLSHVSVDAVSRIQAEFSRLFINFANNFRVWQQWNEQGMNIDQFGRFVRSLIKDESNRDGYLTEGQANDIIDMYGPILNELGEEQTRWGAYTILSTIAARTSARRGSNVFSAGYKRMDRVAQDFFDDSLFRF